MCRGRRLFEECPRDGAEGPGDAQVAEGRVQAQGGGKPWEHMNPVPADQPGQPLGIAGGGRVRYARRHQDHLSAVGDRRGERFECEAHLVDHTELIQPDDHRRRAEAADQVAGIKISPQRAQKAACAFDQGQGKGAGETPDMPDHLLEGDETFFEARRGGGRNRGAEMPWVHRVERERFVLGEVESDGVRASAGADGFECDDTDS